MKQTKIVILGAGHVGTHCALSLMFRSLANEIVLIDTDEEKAKSQALDLDDMGACFPAKVVIRNLQKFHLHDILRPYNTTA